MNAPSDTELILRRALRILRPLVTLLVAKGVDYPRLAAALKRVFIDAAEAQLDARRQPKTITAISLLSGVHRRDVRTLGVGPAAALPDKASSPSMVMQVATRWATDVAYHDEAGQPLPLMLRGAGEPNFEQLVDSVSTDVHPPAVAEELARRGLARIDGDVVRLQSEAFVPSASFGEVLGYVADNTHDHLAAAVGNLLAPQARFLEHSLLADELRPESAERLHSLAKQLWRGAFRRSAQVATELVEADRKTGFADGREMRIRFGVYFYAEPKAAEAQAATPPAPAPRTAPAASTQPATPTTARTAAAKSRAAPAATRRRSDPPKPTRRAAARKDRR